MKESYQCLKKKRGGAGGKGYEHTALTFNRVIIMKNEKKALRGRRCGGRARIPSVLRRVRRRMCAYPVRRGEWMCAHPKNQNENKEENKEEEKNEQLSSADITHLPLSHPSLSV